MQTNFDKTFENNKQTFKQKFGINWSKNHQLYLTRGSHSNLGQTSFITGHTGVFPDQHF